MEPQLPADISVRHLQPLIEAFSEEDDEDGNPIFLYSSFGHITKDYHVFFGRSHLRKYHLTSELIQASLCALPDEDVYPQASVSTTIVFEEKKSEFYYKGPRLSTAFLGNGLLPELLLNEVNTLEILRQNLHPNIVPFHGCVVRRERIVSLVFDRLPMTLFIRLTKEDTPFDIDMCMSSITSAVCHLHSLGLAHNDLNPHNIMVNASDAVFIIDFGSCQPFGKDLITAGTRGWIDEEYTKSAQEHDMSALERIRQWLMSR